MNIGDRKKDHTWVFIVISAWVLIVINGCLKSDRPLVDVDADYWLIITWICVPIGIVIFFKNRKHWLEQGDGNLANLLFGLPIFGAVMAALVFAAMIGTALFVATARAFGFMIG